MKYEAYMEMEYVKLIRKYRDEIDANSRIIHVLTCAISKIALCDDRLTRIIMAETTMDECKEILRDIPDTTEEGLE